MADIIELVEADQQRIRHLWDVLRQAGGASSAAEPGPMAGVWERLAAPIEAHADAEEEICHLPMYGSTPQAVERIGEEAAELEDVRELVDEARLAPAGSPAWWREVEVAVSACLAHLERHQCGIEADFRRRAGRAEREQLGRQWSAFMTARLGDLLPRAHAGGPGCQVCELPIPDDHQHVLDGGHAAVLCACQPCYEEFHTGTR